MSDESDTEASEVSQDLAAGLDRTLSLSNSPWLLGFVQKASDAKALLRHRFPSKVGGRPAWLDPVDLPRENQLRCPSTNRLMRFLLQIYAPVFELDQAFHRTIFLFVSPEVNQ